MTRITNGFASVVDHQRFCDKGERSLDLGGQHRPDLVRRDLAVETALRQRLRDARRRWQAKVGAQQHVLEIVERRGVEPPFGEDVGDALAERPGRARQAVAQALPPRAFRLRGKGSEGRGRRRLSLASAAEQPAKQSGPGVRVVAVGHEILNPRLAGLPPII